MLNRRRHRVVKWAAMDFLLKATRESRGKKKLKHIVILTCRALAIAALIMAVARPLATNGFLSWGGGKLDTIILVLDRSASMEQSSLESAISKRESAISLAQDSIAELGDTKLILIDSATGVPISIASPSTLNEISQTKATDTVANIPSLLDTAVQYILKNNTGRTEIWVASDLQQSDWQPQSGKWSAIRAGLNNLSDQASLRVLSLNSEAESNLSITLTGAQRIENELLLELEIAQGGEANQQDIPLTLSLNGAQSTDMVSLSGNVIKFTKRMPLSGKSGYGYIQLPADTNSRDNTAYFSYGVELPVHTAIVAAKSEAQYYLSLAAAPPGYASQQAKTYLPHESIPWDSLSLVIWQAPIPNDTAQVPLLEFIRKGGIIAFYPPPNTEEQSFLGTQWGLVNKSSASKYFIVQDWDRSDGPLRNGEEGTPIPVSKLKAVKRRGIITDSTSLARWSNDSPFLTRSFHGRGAVYFVSTLPDYTWSNLGDADVILPLTQRLLFKGNQRFGSGYSATLGHLPAEITIDAAKRKRLDKATPTNPLNAVYEAGVYTFGERTLAVNRPAEEDLKIHLDKEALDLALSDVEYSLFEEDTENSSAFAQQLWQIFLVAVLIFLIIESFLCLAHKRKKIDPKN